MSEQWSALPSWQASWPWTSLKHAPTPRENQGLGGVVFIYQPLCRQKTPAGPTLDSVFLFTP